MPRTSLDTAASNSQCKHNSHLGSWCERLWSRMKQSTVVMAAAGLAGLSATSADAQVMPTPVYADSGAQAIWPSTGAPNAQPWPAISPYHSANVLSTQHVNQNGLWMQQVYQKDRQFYFSAEAVLFNFGQPGDKIVGANTLPIDAQGQLISRPLVNPSDIFTDGTQINGTISATALASLFDQVPANFILSGPGVFPYPLLSFDDTVGTEATLDFVGNSTAYPIRTLDSIGELEGVGTRLRWGFDNGDGSGFELTGFISGQASSDFTRGTDRINGRPLTALSFTANGPNIIGIQNGAIPLDNGLSTFPVIGDSLGITGATQKYDIFYSLTSWLNYGGAGISIFNTPVIDSKAARLRFVWGGEYTMVGDHFSFRGIDSGFTPDLTDFQSDLGVLPGGQGGGGGNNQNLLSSRFADLSASQVTPLLTPNSPDSYFEAYLNSTTETHLFGPTVGLRYDFGSGKTFSIWGETVLGLLVNFEKTNVESQNIAEVSHSKTVYGLDPFNEADGSLRPADYTYATDEESEVHASPMFRQAIHGELGLGALFPKLARNPFIGDGYLTAGYSVTVIGQVQRAGEAIYWRGYNGDPTESFPYAITDRSTFVVQEMSLGAEWRY